MSLIEKLDNNFLFSSNLVISTDKELHLTIHQGLAITTSLISWGFQTYYFLYEGFGTGFYSLNLITFYYSLFTYGIEWAV